MHPCHHELASELEFMQGERGLPGRQGESIIGRPGSDGVNGEPGAPGSKGEAGEPGSRGMTGATGAQGLKGDQLIVSRFSPSSEILGSHSYHTTFRRSWV